MKKKLIIIVAALIFGVASACAFDWSVKCENGSEWAGYSGGLSVQELLEMTDELCS